MTKATANRKATTKATASVDRKIHKGKSAFRLADQDAHIAALADKASLLDQERLQISKEIGEALLQAKSLCANDRAFGTWIKDNMPLTHASTSMQDRNDCMKIASQWDAICKLNADGKLNGLGPSAIVKRLRKAEKPASAGNTSKGKPKGKPASKPEAMTEMDLALEVAEKLEAYGLDFKTFATALANIRNKKA